MNWVPIVLGLLKLVVLGATIFFAIKSHRDGEEEQKEERANAGSQHLHTDQAVGASEPD